MHMVTVNDLADHGANQGAAGTAHRGGTPIQKINQWLR